MSLTPFGDFTEACNDLIHAMKARKRRLENKQREIRKRIESLSR
jgi:hypothetical protein